MAVNSRKEDQLALYSWWESWREEHDSSAREHLVLQYMPIVHRTATRIKSNLPQSVDKDDLISWGYMGLLDALQKFDYNLGWAFETYAVPRIRGAIMDGLRSTDWVPRSVRSKAKKLEEAYRMLEQAYSRTPTVDELSDHMQVTRDELHKISNQLVKSQITSLDEPIDYEEEPQTLISRIVDEEAANQEQLVEEQEKKRELAQLIDRLPEKEKLVLSLIYQEELTFSSTAEVLGVTTGRVSQIHSKAISRLREQFKRLDL